MNTMMINRVRAAILALMAAVFLLGLTGLVYGQGKGRHAVLTELDGAVNSISEGYITRSLREADREGAELWILLLDTPGGMLDSTRKIVQSLLSSPVPTVVYVYPSGAHAASAGTFITAAANFAVMAPGTNIGAASPVGGGGEDLPETLKSKVMEDTAALMRDIAEKRGRNAEKLQETVLKATAFTSLEAEREGVIDFVANDLEDLLKKLDGKVIETAQGARTLDTQDIEIRRTKMSIAERFLFFIADPNISFLLLSIGGLGILIEFLHPGLILPGVIGVISLILAFASLGNLPVNWAGVALILLAVALTVMEVYVAGFGILGIGAIVSYILGGILLFSNFGPPSPTLPEMQVSLWVLGITAGVVAGIAALMAYNMSRSREEGEGYAKMESSLIGAPGVAQTELNPRGIVHVRSEQWTAESGTGMVIREGEKVRVTKQEGLVLTVERVEES